MVSKFLCTENFIDTVQYVATDQNGLTATPPAPSSSKQQPLPFDPHQPKVTLLNLWMAALALP